MWKVWLTVGVAGVAALITAIVGFLNEIRGSVILHRTVVSLLLFGGVTLLSVFLSERFLLPYLLKKNNLLAQFLSPMCAERNETEKTPAEASGEEVPAEEAAAQQEIEVEAVAPGSADETAVSSFSPLNADQLDRVSPPNG